jgi:periplasmic protein TonB
MDLRKNLIESSKQKRPKGSWKSTATSFGVHAVALSLIAIFSTSAVQSVKADESPIPVFIQQGGAAPPPPPPPPPPPAPAPSSTSAPETPRLEKVEPVEVPKETFVQPKETPKESPKVVPTSSSTLTQQVQKPQQEEARPSTGGSGTAGVPGGVPGGVAGGVVGGVQGGVVGGEIGGVVGGVIGGVKGGVVGGEVGGVLGGQLGGKGTGPGSGDGEGSGDGSGGQEAPSGPLRVGGDVKAPTVVDRVDPEYTEIARKARVEGVVIVEAIIDERGNVDKVKVIKGLPMGLTESASRAVKSWKFKPGTLNGRPVPVIFNLTVNFRVGN